MNAAGHDLEEVCVTPPVSCAGWEATMKSLLMAVAAAAVLAFWSNGGRAEVLIDGFSIDAAPGISQPYVR